MFVSLTQVVENGHDGEDVDRQIVDEAEGVGNLDERLETTVVQVE